MTLPSESNVPPFSLLWPSDLSAAVQAEKTWLWHGYLKPGGTTLLTSQWKSGKSTLISVLFSRLKTGGQLAGLPLAPGRAVIVSEESPEDWHRRAQCLDFGDHVGFLCRPFRAKPRPEQWRALLDHLAQVCSQHHITLVVIDTLGSFLPGRDENNAGVMMETLLSLQRLTTMGVSVLVTHHPAKKPRPAGLAARGSGALAGFVDILIEMDWYSRAVDDDRRRRLVAFSRYQETPRQLIIKLNPEGTDYLVHDDVPPDEFSQNWQVLRALLENALGKMTRQQILADWPPDFGVPERTTLWRWLEQAVARGLLCRDGTGLRNFPFRYWLPGQEEIWKRNPLYVPEYSEAELDQLGEPEGPDSPERLSPS